MLKFKESQIEDEIMCCPYCGDPQRDKMGCCGETHFENHYIIDGDYYRESEVEIEEDENETATNS
jgi:hypothetical protein